MRQRCLRVSNRLERLPIAFPGVRARTRTQSAAKRTDFPLRPRSGQGTARKSRSFDLTKSAPVYALEESWLFPPRLLFTSGINTAPALCRVLRPLEAVSRDSLPLNRCSKFSRGKIVTPKLSLRTKRRIQPSKRALYSYTGGERAKDV